jgi:hypothetical protein
MWDLTRLREFHHAYHAADGVWNQSAAVAELQFAQGLMLSCALVTPFWTAVAILVVHLAR